MTGHTVPITRYTIPVLDAMLAQVLNATAFLLSHPSTLPNSTIQVSFAAEPFLNVNTHSRGGAWPHTPSRPTTPSAPQILVSLNSGLSQELIEDVMRGMCAAVQAVAVEEGVSEAGDVVYPNYALAGTPLELVYGENVGVLRAVAGRYDPGGVMRLTGGFKF